MESRNAHKIDYGNYYDKIKSMKIWKLFFIVTILVCLFYSVGFCNEISTIECACNHTACCATVCHAATLKLDKIELFSSPATPSSPIPLNTTFHQEPIIRGIDHPPKIIF